MGSGREQWAGAVGSGQLRIEYVVVSVARSMRACVYVMSWPVEVTMAVLSVARSVRACVDVVS